jgi:hypothetical protein
MPRTKRKASPVDAKLREQLRATIRDFARTHPDLTLAEIATRLGESAPVLQTLRVRDLWPADEPRKPPKRRKAEEPKRRNGHAKALAEGMSAAAQQRTAQVRSFLERLDVGASFVASDVMEALQVSRQTALRALALLPEVQMVGKAKSAKYQVIA